MTGIESLFSAIDSITFAEEMGYQILRHFVLALLGGAIIGVWCRWHAGLPVVLLLAVGTELAQPLVGRIRDPFDMGVNLLGGLTGLVLAGVFRVSWKRWRRLRRWKRP